MHETGMRHSLLRQASVLFILRIAADRVMHEGEGAGGVEAGDTG